jgi:hypothetical protein
MNKIKHFLELFIPLNLVLVVIITLFYMFLCTSKGGVVEISDYYNLTKILMSIIAVQIVFFIMSWIHLTEMNK